MQFCHLSQEGSRQQSSAFWTSFLTELLTQGSLTCWGNIFVFGYDCRSYIAPYECSCKNFYCHCYIIIVCPSWWEISPKIAPKERHHLPDLDNNELCMFGLNSYYLGKRCKLIWIACDDLHSYCNMNNSNFLKHWREDVWSCCFLTYNDTVWHNTLPLTCFCKFACMHKPKYDKCFVVSIRILP